MTVRFDLEAPMSWQALTPDQVRAVARLTHGGLLRQECLVALFCELCGVQLSREDETLLLHRGENAMPISAITLGDLSSRFSWILDTEPVETACPFDGLDRYLMDTTFGDYFHADAMVLRFVTTGDMECARKALTDLGIPNPDLTEEEAWALQLWWVGMKNGLKERYPYVFEDTGDDGEGYNPITARQNIMLMLNDGKPQDNEKIEQSNLHDVLSALQNKIEQAKHLEEQMKKMQ